MKTKTDTYRRHYLKLPGRKQWTLIPMISLIVVIVYQGIIHLNPYNLDWMTNGSFRWDNLLRFMLLDQAMIEMITVVVILFGIKVYARLFELDSFGGGIRQLVIYLLKFAPLALLIYFCFAPITTSLRFLYHQYPDYQWATYLESYFFLNKEIYLAYLFPVFLTCYGFILAGLVWGRNEEKEIQTISTNTKPQQTTLEVSNGQGKLMLAIGDISQIQVKSRKYLITSRSGEIYQTPYTLDKLELMLPRDQFIRINRSTILKKNQIRSYAYWEKQKYILRTQKGEEFVISRDRMKNIRENLLNGV